MRWPTVAAAVAGAAAELIRPSSDGPRGLGAKSSPTDVVTQTDLDAEALIRRACSTAATPGAGVLGEEGGATVAGAPRCSGSSIPLDGTVNFLYGLPVMAVSVAAAFDGEVVAGAVVDVLRGETFSRRAGRGRDGRRRVRSRPPPAASSTSRS